MFEIPRPSHISFTSMPVPVDLSPSPASMWGSPPNEGLEYTFPRSYTPVDGLYDRNYGRHQGSMFPVPQEYPYGCSMPVIRDVRPNQPLGVPENRTVALRAEDVKPNLQDLHLMRMSLSEIKACKDIFDSLFEGLEGRIHASSLPCSPENDIVVKVNGLCEGFNSAISSSESLCQRCQGFLDSFTDKLASVSARGGGELFPDRSLQEKCDELFSASLVVEDYVQDLLARLDEVVKSIRSAKDASTHRNRRVWDWFVRSFSILQGKVKHSHAILAPAGLVVGISVTSEACKLAMTIPSMSNTETGLQNVIDLLSRVIPNAAKQAESRLSSVRAYQKILQGPLGVGERFSARMNVTEAKSAAFLWKKASGAFKAAEKYETSRSSSDVV